MHRYILTTEGIHICKYFKIYLFYSIGGERVEFYALKVLTDHSN